MPSRLVHPKRVYLDTANLQDLAHAPALRRDFLDLSRAGEVIPVFSLTHCIEIAKKNDALRSKLIDLLKHLETGPTMWVRHPWRIAELEWRAASEGRLLEDAEVFGGSFADIMDGREPGSRELVGTGSTSDVIEFVRITPGLAGYLEDKLRLVGLHELERAEAASGPKEKKRLTPEQRLDRASRRCPDDVSFSEPPDLDALPANRVMVAHEEGVRLSNKEFTPTDLDDNYHLGCAAYCEIGFVDATTHDRLSRSNYTPAWLRRVGSYEKVLDEIKRSREASQEDRP